jgi:GNAT superfamily N-acetyltransferase
MQLTTQSRLAAGSWMRSEITVLSQMPKALAQAELTEIQRLVIAGGEVNPHTLPTLMSRAFALAYATSARRIVAVGGLKCPHSSYRASVFRKASAQLDPSQFPFELGWIYVTPSVRGQGIADAIVTSLVQRLGGAAAYATSRVDNARMHASLIRASFAPHGEAYSSQLGSVPLQLFVRE